MGSYYVIDVNSEDEFNSQLQLYFTQKYKLESNLNGQATLKKKSYSMAILILLILFFWPGALIYYFTASDDIVVIKQNYAAGPGAASTASTAAPDEEIVSYCGHCGAGLTADSKFCPGCGADVATPEEEVKAIEAPVAEKAVEEEVEEEAKPAELIE